MPPQNDGPSVRFGKWHDHPQVLDGLLKGGGRRAAFSVATSNRWKDDQGAEQERTTWHRVSAFDRAADIVRDNVKKGMRVLVEGPMEYRDYEKDGVKQRAAEIVLRGAPGERLDFLSRPQPT
jgi:single stranded DNA-binding protein